jgi:inorganic pyrophosphatase
MTYLVAVVEIPKGSRNKYEIDHERGVVWLDRTLFTATQYPADYGYIDKTLAEEGDPLDTLVLLEEPTFPGCHIRVRPVGIFSMSDEAGTDPTLLSVPEADPRWSSVHDLVDVAPFLLDEIAHFFHVYKQLEPRQGDRVLRLGGRGASA